MFRLNRKEIAEILASEVAGWTAAGMIGAGTVASLSLRYLRELVENSAEVRFPQPVNAPSDEFLNQYPAALAPLYDRERLVRGRLLYVEQANFIDRLVTEGKVEIHIDTLPGVLTLAPFADPATEGLREAGFARLREVGKYRHDSDVIRVSQIEPTPDGARLVMQKARYSDQARSNLILDFAGDGRARTLRMALHAETPGLLPALDDRRLANTLGVTVLVFYRDETGILTPFLVPRTRKTAVMNRGLWSDSASGAAEWPRDELATPRTFEAYVMDDLYKELKDEIGLDRADLSLVLPLAIGREIMRAGKPQMFFIGFTPLNRKALIQRMQAARELARRNPIEPEEIYRMPLLRRPPRLGDTSDLYRDQGEMGVDPQCLASLHYALTFLQKLGPQIARLT